MNHSDYELQKENSLEWAKLETSEVVKQIAITMDQLGVSRAELARRLGKSRAYVTQIFQNDINFTIDTLIKIAECLDCMFEIRLSKQSINTIKSTSLDYVKFKLSLKENKNEPLQSQNIVFNDETTLAA